MVTAVAGIFWWQLGSGRNLATKKEEKYSGEVSDRASSIGFESKPDAFNVRQ
jgi:hypothetical protein